MNTPTGLRVQRIPLAEVRKTLAQAGLDVIGNQPELRQRLVAHLDAQARAAHASLDVSPAPRDSEASDAPSNAAIIQAALACGDDYAALLSLAGGEPVTPDSPVAVMRRAFLRLSLKLHPDKNGSIPGAPAAFQALVLAFERLSQQQPQQEDKLGRGGRGSDGDDSAPRRPRERVDVDAPRSNEGCFQTRLYCPRW